MAYQFHTFPPRFSGPYWGGQAIAAVVVESQQAGLGNQPAVDLERSLRYRVAATGGAVGWDIQCFEYSYRVLRFSREWFAYHWSGESTKPGSVKSPHIHIGKQNLAHQGLAELHLPTGLVTIAQVYKMLMRDAALQPVRVTGKSLEQTVVSAMDVLDKADVLLARSFEWVR